MKIFARPQITFAIYVLQLIPILLLIAGFNQAMPFAVLAMSIIAAGFVYSRSYAQYGSTGRNRIFLMLVMWFIVLPAILLFAAALVTLNGLVASRLAFLPNNAGTTLLQWTVSIVLVPAIFAALFAEPARKAWEYVASKLFTKQPAVASHQR